MASKAAKLAREKEERIKREELAEKWRANVEEVKEAIATNWDDLPPEARLAVAFFKEKPYEEVIPQDKFIEDGVKEWDRERRIVVSGKYKDEQTVSNTYKQRFLVYTRACRKEVFDSLKKLVPQFTEVFGKEPASFERMFDWHEVSALVEPDRSLDSEIETTVFEIERVAGASLPRILVRPNKVRSQDYSHRWGNFRLLLEFAWLDVISRRGMPTAEQRDLTIQAVRSTFVVPEFEGGNQSITTLIGQVLDSVSEMVVDQSLAEPFYFTTHTRHILGRMIGSDVPENVDAFVEFVISLLDWAAEHGLEKDWLIRYACYFLDREVHTDGADMFEDPVPPMIRPSLFSFPFEFRFTEWLPGEEAKEEYEARLNQAFQTAVDNFFQDNGRRLGLDRSKDGGVKGVTKPIDPEFEWLKWLIAWNEGATYQQIARAFAKEWQSIRNGITRLKDFDLPIRKGLPGRRSLSVTRERLEQIKGIQI